MVTGTTSPSTRYERISVSPASCSIKSEYVIASHAFKPQYKCINYIPTWEQRKLGNCGTTYSGLSGKTKEDFGHGNARFVPYTNVFDNPLADTERLEAVEIDSSQNKVAYGDVFFTVSSETPNEVGMSSVWLSDQDDVYLNSFCFGYRQDSTFDPHYLAYMLRSSSIRSDLTLLAQGISRFNISKNKVMELSVAVPSAAEQKQIGQYFARLDDLITLHQRKRQWLKWLDEGGEGTHHDIDILVFKFADDMKISVLCGVHACMTKSLGHTGNRYAGKQQQRGMGVP